jgi:hypothetical protein
MRTICDAELQCDVCDFLEQAARKHFSPLPSPSPSLELSISHYISHLLFPSISYHLSLSLYFVTTFNSLFSTGPPIHSPIQTRIGFQLREVHQCHGLVIINGGQQCLPEGRHSRLKAEYRVLQRPHFLLTSEWRRFVSC